MPILMFIIFISVYFGANYYVFFRLWQMLPAGSWLRPALVGVGVLLAASIFLYLFIGKRLPYGLTSFLSVIGTSWIIILLYAFLIILVADLLPLTGLYDRGAVLRSNPITFCLIVGVVALIVIAGNVNYHSKRRVEIAVDASTHTGRPLERPLKIVAISDLHIGYTIGPRELGRWVKMINKESPDIILIAGDLIDSDVRPLYKKDMVSVLKQLTSRYGIYIVPGNHEYIAGIDKSLEFIDTTGFTLLRDTTVRVAGVDIMGRDDRTNKRRASIVDLVAGRDASVPLLIVDHQPVALEEAVSAGAAIQISGHTHRGQVWPITWLTDRIYEDSHGLITKDGTMIFVSSGLGIWGGKFRIGSVSDYAVIEIE